MSKVLLVSSRSCQHPDTKVEIKTPAGHIDCLTKIEIVEIKVITKWKDGLGQLLAYSVFYPNHRKVLMLFGKTKSSLFESIEQVCCNDGVERSSLVNDM